MNIPLKLIRRVFSGPMAATAGLVLVVLVVVISVLSLSAQLDGARLSSIWSSTIGQPQRVLLGVVGFGLAFVIRSVVWARSVPKLGFGQSMAGIHVALGANHVLPFRLGEPIRMVSASRRSTVSFEDAVASTVALRASDIFTLLLIGGILGPMVLVRTLGWLGFVLLAVGMAALAVLFRLAHRRGLHPRAHIPRPGVWVATASAWFFEAILIWQIAPLAGVDLRYLDALLVTSIAVSAQLVAIAPGGLGTYEAATTAALVLTGSDPKPALALAVTTHILKTVYSLATGVIAMILPRPGLLGALRVPKQIAPAQPLPISDGPVVLFMPAYQEGPRIAEVLDRTPSAISGRSVIRLVIDDGSTDNTVAEARKGGAEVVSFETNRGLGAAVAEGFRRAIADHRASVVVFCDADGEYDPADLDDLVRPIVEGTADYVVGSRFAGDIEHMRPHRRIGNLTLTRWVRWMTRTGVTDGQSGYRALSAQAAEAVEMAHDYNYAQVLTIDLIQKGFRYAEVPITYRFRDSGESFVKLGVYLRKVLPAVWRLLNSSVEVSQQDPLDQSVNMSILNQT